MQTFIFSSIIELCKRISLLPWYTRIEELPMSSPIKHFYVFYSVIISNLLNVHQNYNKLGQRLFEFIINQIMINQDRRKCHYYGQSQYLKAYETSNQKIINKYQQSTNNICQEGIKYLQQITEQYLKQRKLQMEQPQQANQNSSTQLFSFRIPQEKKALIQHDQSTQNESKNIIMCTGQKNRQSKGIKNRESFESREHNNQQDDEDYIKKSLKKLGINEEDYENDYQDAENQKENWQNNDEYKDKTIQEIIMQSHKKIQEAIQNKKSVNFQNQLEDDDSEGYQITEYSSNQSSNENDYEENIRSLTGQFTQQGQISSQQSFFSMKNPSSYASSAAYITSNITLSPKKSKSKAKRLYLGSKKIPRWAEDLKKVSEQAQRQRINGHYNPQDIYGICVIEKLNTRLILKHQPKYPRGSSAKWKKYPQNHFIC